ncbi:MAG: TIM barrel protein, partial [archaeon]|nr:TIM barrel protein [archaeon]
KREKNIDYLVSGLKVADRLNTVAVFHLGFYGDKRFDELKGSIVEAMQTALDKSDIKDGRLGIETTGKQKAIGTCDEIIELVKIIGDPRVMPVIDWSHVYARNDGTFPASPKDFKRILNKFEDALGYRPSYFHGGGVEYKNGNEVRHISSRAYEPPLPYLFAALHDLKYSDFTFIVESPDSIEDVRLLRQVWKSPEDYFDNIPSRKAKNLLDFR